MPQHEANNDDSPEHQNNSFDAEQTTTEHDPSDLTQATGPAINQVNQESVKQPEKEAAKNPAAAQSQETIPQDKTSPKQTWLGQKLEAWRGIKESIQLGYQQLKKLFVEYPKEACIYTGASFLTAVLTIQTSRYIGEFAALFVKDENAKGAVDASKALAQTIMQEPSSPQMIGTLLTVCLVGTSFCMFHSRRSRIQMDTKLSNNTSNELYSGLGALSFEELDQGTNNIVNEARENIASVSLIPLNALDKAVSTLQIGYGGYCLLAISPIAAAITAVALLPHLRSSFVQYRANMKFYEESRPKKNLINLYANNLTNFENLQEITTRGIGQDQAKQVINESNAHTQRELDHAEKYFKIERNAQIISQFFQGLGIANLVWLVQQNAIDAKSLGQMIGALIFLNQQIVGFTSSLLQLDRNLNIFKRIKPLLEKKPLKIERTEEEQKKIDKAFGDGQQLNLEICNVSYIHRSATNPCLKNISFDIKAGDSILLVGPNGGGKTTLSHLITGLRRSSQGSITANGIDISKLNSEEWVQRLSFVRQEQRLIKGLSIRDNLVAGHKQNSDTLPIEEVTEICGIDDFIKNKKNGYETIFGDLFEDGSGFSGGEIERIRLAAAISKKSPILLLDEVQKNMDAASKKTFTEGLPKLMAKYKYNPTIIQVAHDFKHIRPPFKIVVLNKNGDIEGVGTHDELMKSSATYKELYESR